MEVAEGEEEEEEGKTEDLAAAEEEVLKPTKMAHSPTIEGHPVAEVEVVEEGEDAAVGTTRKVAINKNKQKHNHHHCPAVRASLVLA